MRPTKRYFSLMTQVVIWLLLTATALGQAAAEADQRAAFVELLQARKKQIDELRDLDEAAKAKVRDLYDQALGEMEKAKSFGARLASFEKRAAQAPAEIEQTKADLAALPPQPIAAIPADATLPQIEQAISRRQAELESWRRELADVETELKGRGSRRAEIPKQISRRQQVLGDINGELQAPAPADESSPVDSARRMMLVAQRRAAEQEILCCEKELAASKRGPSCCR